MILSDIAKNILQDRNISYIVTDRLFRAVEQVGVAHTPIMDMGNDAILGQSLLDLFPEFVGSEETVADVLAGKLPRFELSLINRAVNGGRTLYINLVCLPRFNPTNQIIGIICLIQDVTEMTDINQQLVQARNDLQLAHEQLKFNNEDLTVANAELRHLAEMKTMFVSVAAHELRSPLTSIYGFMGLLLDELYGPLNKEQRECLEVVQKSTDRLKTIVDKLLTTTRIETDRIELTLQPTNLVSIVRSVATELRPQLDAKTLHLNLHIEPHLPLALCDKTHAVQIVSNLVHNAVKYTRNDGLISVTVAKSGKEGFLQVSVADNGIGISRQEQPKMFKRFSRLSNVTQTGATGVGLGLYITRSLVDLHGGDIWFESNPNRGSTFYVTFPIADKRL